MNKILLSATMAAALLGAGGAFAQSAECQSRLPDGRSVCDVPNPGGVASPHNNATLMGLERRDAPRYYADRGVFGVEQQRYYRNERSRHDRDGDGIRDSRDRDRDGDGIPNNRDRNPDNPRRR